MNMRAVSSLSVEEMKQVQVASDQISHIFGLPPGTLLGIITKLLPVLLQLFGGGGLGGIFGGGGGTTTTPPAP